MNRKRTTVRSTDRGDENRRDISTGLDDRLRASFVERRRSQLERLQAVPLKFLRFEAVRDRTGLSRSTIWRLERRGEFPRHRRIAPNAVAWLEAEINDWMLDKTSVG